MVHFLYVQDYKLMFKMRMLATHLQSAEEKGLCSEARPAEAVGLVLGVGANDIGALEGCDWPTGKNRTRRVKR